MRAHHSMILLAVAAALLSGCARAPVWSVDEKTEGMMRDMADPSTPATSVAYKTSNGDHAVLWLDDKGWLDDPDACRRRLVRYAAYHGGEPPKVAGNIAIATSADSGLSLIWIDKKPVGRWADVIVAKGRPWLPLAQSFVREVMNEPQAAEDLAEAKDAGWTYGASVIATKRFGEIELPPQWFLEFEALGVPPQAGDNSLVLKDHKGALQFVETSPDRLAKVGSLKHAGFEAPPEVADGITRLTSKQYPNRVAFIVRKAETIVVLVAGAAPDEGFVEEAAALAKFFDAALQK